MELSWIVLLFTLEGCRNFVGAQLGNAPPTLQVLRTWEVDDTYAEGTVITRATASDTERDSLVFGLERHYSYDKIEVPFKIDPKTGVVTTNASLANRGGDKFLLSVTVTDGYVTSKNEVYVKIINTKTSTPSGISSNPPVLPFYVPSNIPPQFPNRPPFPNQGLPFPNQGPPFPNRPRPTLPPIQPKQDEEVVIQKTDKSAQAENSPVTKSVAPSASNTTTVKLVKASTTEATTVTTGQPPVDNMAYMVIPIAVVCSVLVSLSLVAFLFRRRIWKYRSKIQKEDMRKESSGGIVLDDPAALQHWRGPRASSNRYEGWETERNPQPPPLQGERDAVKRGDKWEFPRHHLKVFNILGEGCFGQVWRCEALDIDGKEGPSIVAVKTLKENANEKERTDLQKELEVMKMLDPHPNVVRLIGCCTEKDPLFVIMEFVALGKLQSFLRNSRAERHYGNMSGQSETLTSGDLTGFAYQCARGMDYLSSKGIIHRDLAARNILVNEDRVCKVADFGFARDLIDSHVYERKSEGRLPIRWMAPESLYDNVFSVKSDVWSFGILLWEIVTLGSTPYPGMAAADVMRKVRDGFRLEKPEHCRRELYNIMFYCWDKDSKERPTFKELVTLLESLLLTETEYIELERFPDHSYYNMSSLSGEKL